MSKLLLKGWERFAGFLHVFRRPLFLGLAVAWPVLGYTSGSSPLLSRLGWVLLCGVVGGTALIVARWGSTKALNAYVTAAVSVGMVRGAAFLIPTETLDPVTLEVVRAPIPVNPLMVWTIVALTTLILWAHLTGRTAPIEGPQR